MSEQSEHTGAELMFLSRTTVTETVQHSDTFDHSSRKRSVYSVCVCVCGIGDNCNCTRYHQVIMNKSLLVCVHGSVFAVKVSVMISFVKVSRQMKLELQDSEYFSVVGPEDAGNKVAPGLSATFTVLFTPQENKVWKIESKMNYHCNLHLKG